MKLAKLESQMSAAAQLYKHRSNDQLKMIKDEVKEIVAEVDNPQAEMNKEVLGLDE